MSWLDKLLTAVTFRWNGTDLPVRPKVNLLGGTVADDPTNNQLNVSLGGGSGSVQLQDATNALLPLRAKVKFATGTVTDDAANNRSIVTAGGGSPGWTTVLDLDFTAESAQTLVAGPVTIGGKVWEYHNERARLATALVPGSGLVFAPAATANYNDGNIHTCPMVQLPLGQLGIPNLDWQTPLRIYVYVSTATVADHGDQVFAALNFLGSYMTSIFGGAFCAFDSVGFYGMGQATTDLGLQTLHEFGNALDGSAVAPFPTLATYRVFMIETAPASRELRSFFGDFTGHWPDLATEMYIGPSSLYSSNLDAIGTHGSLGPTPVYWKNIGANYTVSLGMQAGSAAASGTIARIRVDYKNDVGIGPKGDAGAAGGATGAAGGGLGGTYPNPDVLKIGAVVVSGAPTAGQVLTATAPAAAIWATPGGGGGGLPMYFISPADRGLVRGAGQSGNFSTGMNFVFMTACTWTGVRFSATYAGTKIWKARAYDLTAALALANATSGPLPSGTNTVLFGVAVPITDPSHVYVVSIYDTTPGLFCGYSPVAGADYWTNNPYGSLLGPNVWLLDDSFFAAGDAQPVSGGSSMKMAVEPVFTVP